MAKFGVLCEVIADAATPILFAITVIVLTWGASPGQIRIVW
jgi:hypothetical protein